MGEGLRRFLIGAAAIVLVVPVLGLPGAAISAKPKDPPSSPRDVAASPGVGSAKVSWRAPKKAGGAPVDRYKVVSSAKGVPRKTVKVGKGKRSYVVRGLVNGKTYTFTVLAHNALGWSRASGKATAVPRTVPTAPRNLLADSVERTVDLTWQPPASNGGESVDGYRVQQSSNGGTTWATVASPATTQSTLTGLAYGTPYRFRVSAVNAAGAGPPSGFVAVTLVPPPCPDPLPTTGPYLEVTCDPADGVVVHTCLNADWKDLNGDAADGCEATMQMPTFVTGNAQDTDSATAYADKLTGSFWLSGYPGDRDPEDRWEVNPLPVPIPPSCPTVGCPGGQPQDPPPSLQLDFAPQAGDLPRRSVTSVIGSNRFDITYRARVTTPEPIAVQIPIAGDCLLSIDSTAGANADLRFDLQVSFTNSGWLQQHSVNNLSVSQLDALDFTISGGIGCQISSPGAGFVNDLLTDLLAQHFTEQDQSLCGATDPYWWQTCRPIVEEPPPPPPDPETPSTCPTAPPPAGPYLTLTCNGGNLVRTCHPDWLDQNQLIADGCERAAGGLVAMVNSSVTDQAIADRLTGSFYLGGYPGGTGSGTRYVAPDPWPVPILGCAMSGGISAGCLDGNDQDPMPSLELDFETGGLPDRRIGIHNAAQGYTDMQFQAVARTNAPVVFRQTGVTCQVSIDTSDGADDDMVLRLAALGSGQGPLEIVRYDDSGGLVTVGDIEDGDITIGPHRWCSYWAQGMRSTIRLWVRDTLLEWGKREGRLCGAPAPYYWQRAPVAGCG